MSGSLSFQPASDLGPSPDEREEFAAKIRAKDAELEELREAKQSGATQPQERLALVQLLSDMSKKIEDLEKLTAKQASEIEDLQKESKAIGQEVYDVHDMAKTIISDACKRITALEECPDPLESEAAKKHISELYDHMKAIGRKQVSFQEASRCLKLSKSRVLQFKAVIALDDRFIIVPSESHKQKELIRLREYYKRNGTV